MRPPCKRKQGLFRTTRGARGGGGGTTDYFFLGGADTRYSPPAACQREAPFFALPALSPQRPPGDQGPGCEAPECPQGGKDMPLPAKGAVAFFSSRKSNIAVLPIDCRQGHLVFELSSPSRVEGRSSVASIRSAGLGICPSLSGLGGPSARRTWIPAGVSSDCRCVPECPSLAPSIACAIFSVDFRPSSGSRRRVMRGVVHEVNKVVVFQLLSELKRVNRCGMMTK